ncbi:MAG TPA: hypothetical protein VND64_04600 [Pirellulales bacterium]|nr:hypothetical protein [Pirellulales bacterium]
MKASNDAGIAWTTWPPASQNTRELQEADRRRRPGFLVAAGKFAADRGQRASGGRMVSVTDSQ